MYKHKEMNSVKEMIAVYECRGQGTQTRLKSRKAALRKWHLEMEGERRKVVPEGEQLMPRLHDVRELVK